LVYASKLLKDIPQANEVTDEQQVTFNWDKAFTLDTDSFKKGEPDLKGDIIIYTDGSLIKDRAGSGFTTIGQAEEEGYYSLGYERSVFQAEIFAIQKATERLIEAGIEYKRIIYHVDSQAALLAISGNTITKNSVQRTVNALNHLGLNNMIRFRWVKSHVGHAGNERADLLAKQGALDPLIDDPDRPNISRSIIRRIVKDKVDAIWNEEWKELPTCRQTKLWFPEINRRKSEQIVKLNRKEHSLITQLLTGHSYTSRHSALIDPSIDPKCSKCDTGEEQTGYHLITRCPTYALQRRMIFGTHEIDTSLSWEVSQVVQFLRDTQLYDSGDETR
jgi:ribonuclease HI